MSEHPSENVKTNSIPRIVLAARSLLSLPIIRYTSLAYKLFPPNYFVESEDVILPMRSGGLARVRLDEWSGWRLFFTGDHEYEVKTIVRDLLPKNPVIFDAGANIGLFSISLACQSDSQVVCVEPIPHAAERLRENIDLNNLQNISVHQCALSGEEGELTLFVPTNGRFDNVGSVDLNWAKRKGLTTAPLSVPCRRIDDIVSDENLSRVDLLKIDVEGAEVGVIGGSEKTLAEFRPIILVECLSFENMQNFQSEIDGLGYEWFRIRSGVFNSRSSVLERVGPPLRESRSELPYVLISVELSSKFSEI